MIEVVNRLIELLSELVFVPCVVANLSQEINAPRMNDNFQILYPLDTIQNAVFALLRRRNTKTERI
jgi:hypothetical protein